LAADPDREGEAIAWHLKEALSLKYPKRAAYTEITESAVLKGIENARTIDMNLVRAQECRRVLDRLVGFGASRALSNVAGKKTVGRADPDAGLKAGNRQGGGYKEFQADNPFLMRVQKVPCFTQDAGYHHTC
jgi:reverse gyrase